MPPLVFCVFLTLSLRFKLCLTFCPHVFLFFPALCLLAQHSLSFSAFGVRNFLRLELVSAETAHLRFEPDYLGTTRTFLVQASAATKAEHSLIGHLIPTRITVHGLSSLAMQSCSSFHAPQLDQCCLTLE
jgi:hypothetical protein